MNRTSIIKDHGFLFSELVKRDFKKKYKRTVLGVLWSLLSPLLSLLVMSLIFSNLFGRNTPHYLTYLFAGNIVFSFYSESVSASMTTLYYNAPIFTKIRVPKYLFLLSRTVSSLINFLLTFSVFFVFLLIDGITPDISMLTLIFPIAFLYLFCLGLGLILSSLFIFFRDLEYLWSIFTMLVMYTSAIFYTTDAFPEALRPLFLLNPVFVYIGCIRSTVLGIGDGFILHGLALAYAILFLTLGILVYRMSEEKFIYYF